MKNNTIIHELHLGTQLNSSLKYSDRADFRFLMTLLSEQAQEFAQFQLEKESVKELSDAEDALKRELGVHPSCRLQADSQYYQKVGQINQSLHYAGQTSMNLARYMVNDALSQFNDSAKLDDNVIDNCSLHTKRRLDILAGSTSNSSDEPLAIQHDITQLADIAEKSQALLF